MKISPQNEAKLITVGILTAVAVFIALAALSPEFLYVIILGAVCIGAIRLVYEMSLNYVDRRNTLTRLRQESKDRVERARKKLEKNDVHV